MNATPRYRAPGPPRGFRPPHKRRRNYNPEPLFHVWAPDDNDIDRPLPPNHARVLVTLQRLEVRRNGARRLFRGLVWVRRSRAYIAEAAGVSVSTVDRARRRAERAGLLEQHRMTEFRGAERVRERKAGGGYRIKDLPRGPRRAPVYMRLSDHARLITGAPAPAAPPARQPRCWDRPWSERAAQARRQQLGLAENPENRARQLWDALVAKSPRIAARLDREQWVASFAGKLRSKEQQRAGPSRAGPG